MRSDVVKQLARECGFDLVGITPAVPSEDADLFHSWVTAGMAGAMTYLTDHRATIRSDPRQLLSSAKSIVCLGLSYNTAPEAGGEPIARYARGEDYHDVLKRKLGNLVQAMQDRFGGFDYNSCVDTAPLLERSYARLAGLGWIGKNTCLINQHAGSYIFLGELLVSLELEPDAPPPFRCGTCTRCIDVCPTQALVPGGYGTQLDSRRCISYLTIELRGNIPEDLREDIGAHVFGCDICQQVCPWNSKAAPASELAGGMTESQFGGVEQLATLSPDQFRALFRHTPVWRTKYSGFLRNVAVVMGNAGDGRFRPILESLAESADQVVAEHAAWALRRLNSPVCETTRT